MQCKTDKENTTAAGMYKTVDIPIEMVFHYSNIYSCLILPWMGFANWAFDILLFQKMWEGKMLFGNDQDDQNKQTQTSQYLATLYIAVLILSLRHQTLFFIMRNDSFPFSAPNGLHALSSTDH